MLASYRLASNCSPARREASSALSGGGVCTYLACASAAALMRSWQLWWIGSTTCQADATGADSSAKTPTETASPIGATPRTTPRVRPPTRPYFFPLTFDFFLRPWNEPSIRSMTT